MTPSTLTYLQAAEQVLRSHSPGAPMHYRRITELALSSGLIEPSGVTPEATMVAQLSTDIKRRGVAGRAPRFRAFGRGLYGLAEPTDALGGTIDEHNRRVRERLRERLSATDPQEFELLIAALLSMLGFEDVEVTKYSGDGGIDVRATLTVGGITAVQTAVQVKRWSNNVAGKTVRELRGGLGPHERGLIITLSDFTRDARTEAAASDRAPITIINGDQLLDLLIDNGIGVTARSVPILQLDQEALAEGLSEESPETNAVPGVVRVPTRYSGTKALSMWPLPGGKHAWKQTLDTILRHVAATAPSWDNLINWLISSFDKVESEKVARGYIVSVLRPLDLVQTEGEQVVVTATGAEYLDDRSSEALLAIALAKVAGFEEILSALDERPMTSEELLQHLRDTLQVTWQTDAQVRFRLGWLEILGAAVEEAGLWRRA